MQLGAWDPGMPHFNILPPFAPTARLSLTGNHHRRPLGSGVWVRACVFATLGSGVGVRACVFACDADTVQDQTLFSPRLFHPLLLFVFARRSRGDQLCRCFLRHAKPCQPRYLRVGDSMCV